MKPRWLVLSVLLPPALAAAQAAPAAPTPGIADNSFLLEEAYNQEPGVIQHISSFTRFGEGDWSYAFTEEWPAPSQTHQLSLTLPVQASGEHSGLGDAAINYRYQALDGSRGGVAVSPRLSLLLSTGDADRGLGSGGAGLQVNLPLSIQRSSRFVTHSNLGATWIPTGRRPLTVRASHSDGGRRSARPASRRRAARGHGGSSGTRPGT